jgi:hypothetical protein
MLDDPRFLRGVAQFYSHWLPVSGFAELARDAEGFDGAVASALETSLLRSVEDVYTSRSGNISDLLTGESYLLNDVLRDFYGVEGTGTEFSPTPMTGQARYGILTHPGLMALLARPGESNPISRGLYLLRGLLCTEIPPPPQGEIPDLPPVEQGVSTRERLSQHTGDPTCKTCHDIIDPAGFVFEAFDEVGRYRTMDHGRPVDTSGSLHLDTDVDGAFQQGSEFLAKLADSASVRACFAGHYLDFALGHARPDPRDACSLESVSQSFAANGDLTELVLSIATSESFRMRLAEGVGP